MKIRFDKFDCRRRPTLVVSGIQQLVWCLRQESLCVPVRGGHFGDRKAMTSHSTPNLPVRATCRRFGIAKELVGNENLVRQVRS